MFFESPAAQDLLQFLTVALGQAVPCVFLLVGESGIGKTMLLRALQTRLLALDQGVVFHRCAADLARCEEQLGSIADPAAAADAIYLIDGAESWDEESTSWIDQLFKRAVATGFAARIVIAGRTEAETRLRRLVSPVLASTAAFTRLQLEPIPQERIGEFIHLRLPQTLAGPRPVSPEALRKIAETSAGIPRRIVEQASAMMEAGSSQPKAGDDTARRAMARKLLPIAGSTAAMLTIAAALIWLIKPGGLLETELPSRADASVAAPPAPLASAPPVLEVASAAMDDPVAVESYEPSAGSEPLEGLIVPATEDGNRAFEADDLTSPTSGSADEQGLDPADIPATEPVMPLPDMDAQATDNTIDARMASNLVAMAMAFAETALAMTAAETETMHGSVEPSPTPILIEEEPVPPEAAISVVDPVPATPAFEPNQAPAPAEVSSSPNRIPDATEESSQPALAPIPLAATPMRQARPAKVTAQSVALRRRGDELLRSGDIAAARLLFERAGRGGDIDAMMALARSYEAETLRQLGAVGLAPDPERARHWHRLAAEARDVADADGGSPDWR